MIKKRDLAEEADKLAEQLADKPYNIKAADTEIVNTSITLSRSMLYMLEDEALKNKRQGGELKNVSAIIRAAVENYFNK